MAHRLPPLGMAQHMGHHWAWQMDHHQTQHSNHHSSHGSPPGMHGTWAWVVAAGPHSAPEVPRVAARPQWVPWSELFPHPCPQPGAVSAPVPCRLGQRTLCRVLEAVGDMPVGRKLPVWAGTALVLPRVSHCCALVPPRVLPLILSSLGCFPLPRVSMAPALAQRGSLVTVLHR